MKNQEAQEELREKLTEDLIDIGGMFGEMKLTSDAIKWGKAWYEKHWGKLDAKHEMSDQRFAGYRARKQTHLHKLAMILSAAKRDTMTIEVEDLEEAEKLAGQIEPHMQRVFNEISSTGDTRMFSEVLELVQRCGVISKQEAFAKLSQTMTVKQFVEALQAGVEGGYLALKQEQGAVMVRWRKASQRLNEPAQ